METNDNTDQLHETNCQQDWPVQGNAGSISNIPPDIVDLTDGDDEMDVVHILETLDRKPILDNAQSQYGMNNPSELNQNAAPI